MQNQAKTFSTQAKSDKNIFNTFRINTILVHKKIAIPHIHTQKHTHTHRETYTHTHTHTHTHTPRTSVR